MAWNVKFFSYFKIDMQIILQGFSRCDGSEAGIKNRKQVFCSFGPYKMYTWISDFAPHLRNRAIRWLPRCFYSFQRLYIHIQCDRASFRCRNSCIRRASPEFIAPVDALLAQAHIGCTLTSKGIWYYISSKTKIKVLMTISDWETQTSCLLISHITSNINRHVNLNLHPINKILL